MVVSGESDAFDLSTSSPSTGRTPYPEKALSTVSGRASTPGAAQFDPSRSESARRKFPKADG
jgi:hypothetical protein